MPDDMEVTVELVIIDDEGWLPTVDDILTFQNPMQRKLLVLKPVDVVVSGQEEVARCKNAEKQGDKCLGYQRAYDDDAPEEKCKACKDNIFYED